MKAIYFNQIIGLTDLFDHRNLEKIPFMVNLGHQWLIFCLNWHFRPHTQKHKITLITQTKFFWIFLKNKRLAACHNAPSVFFLFHKNVKVFVKQFTRFTKTSAPEQLVQRLKFQNLFKASF